MKRVVVIVVALISCGLSACDQEPSDRNPSGRIIPGEGVDGIRFGDTLLDIRRRLGASRFDDLGHSGPHRVYAAPGESEGLEILLRPVQTNSEYDVRYFTVDYFRIERPFEGSTAEGIGLGSSSEQVLGAYGAPVAKRKEADGLHSYVYCVRDREFWIGLERDEVTMIGMGFDQPPIDHRTPKHCQ